MPDVNALQVLPSRRAAARAAAGVLPAQAQECDGDPCTVGDQCTGQLIPVCTPGAKQSKCFVAK
jgi:hypothetical protein